MPKHNSNLGNGWVTMIETTLDDCREALDIRHESASPESPADSLGATLSENSLSANESRQSVESSPVTSGTGSSTMPRNTFKKSFNNNHLPLQKMGGRMCAEEGPNANNTYAIASNPRSREIPPQISNSALPRTLPGTLTPARLIALFPGVLKDLSEAKVNEWIETCNRYGSQSYTPAENFRASETEDQIEIEIATQQDASNAEHREKPEDPESDPALSEDSE